KNAIVAEAARILRPGGRYAIHELGLVPEDLSEDIKTEIRKGLARAIKVNARPLTLTLTEWTEVLEANGFQVIKVDTAPMALLQPRRIIADEGLVGALRFVKNLLLNPDARKRVLQMRRTFNTYRDHLNAVAIVATRK
ncbi:MAG: SAM-dependent methyltransferase, partial [Corynebacterium casei]